MCGKRGRRFTESTENELAADGMLVQLKCRHGLEASNSFLRRTGSEFLGKKGFTIFFIADSGPVRGPFFVRQ